MKRRADVKYLPMEKKSNNETASSAVFEAEVRILTLNRRKTLKHISVSLRDTQALSVKNCFLRYSKAERRKKSEKVS